MQQMTEIAVKLQGGQLLTEESAATSDEPDVTALINNPPLIIMIPHHQLLQFVALNCKR